MTQYAGSNQDLPADCRKQLKSKQWIKADFLLEQVDEALSQKLDVRQALNYVETNIFGTLEKAPFAHNKRFGEPHPDELWVCITFGDWAVKFDNLQLQLKSPELAPSKDRDGPGPSRAQVQNDAFLALAKNLQHIRKQLMSEHLLWDRVRYERHYGLAWT